MMFIGLLIASVLSVSVFYGCILLRGAVAPMGIELDPHVSPPTITYLPEPSATAMQIAQFLEILQIILPVLIFAATTLLTTTFFYRIKLKEPLAALKSGAEHIMENNLDFRINSPQSSDELGQLCIAFEKMRAALLSNNRLLWRQAEERKRLNAAFAHDLRNPVTVLKGSVKLLRNGIRDEQTIDRMEHYTLRIEQYIDAMSSIQRLEQIPVQAENISCDLLRSELAETARLLAPAISCAVTLPDAVTVHLDHGLFMTVAENLISNAARFTQTQLSITVELQSTLLSLSVTDDGPGFPAELLQNSPKPFGKTAENTETTHLGMGLYSSQTLCSKHGGKLILKNTKPHGAAATALFQTDREP